MPLKWLKGLIGFCSPMKFLQSFLLALVLAPSAALAQTGVPITYELPPVDSGSETYLVTLAITDPKNPDWIISTFVAGQPRTVTPENKGKFTETWDGLDENFMPVPPGEYGVKGIYMPAHKWSIDNDWHAITPKFAGGISPWLPPLDSPQTAMPFGGDPVNAPLRDVAVGPNGVAVFYYQYLENGKNAPMFDLNQPINYAQFLRAFPSGGAGGGPCVATDGETVWAFSTDGGPKYVYRTDQKNFGKSPGANRNNGYLPEGWVTAMTAVRAAAAGKSYLYVAQRGLIEDETRGSGKKRRAYYSESDTEFVDKITVHDGDNGDIVATLSLPRPFALTASGDKLYALSRTDKGAVVMAVPLKNGLPDGEWKTVFEVPATLNPFDLEVDSRGRFYLSDSAANKVYQLDASGKVTRTFGRLDAQKPGAYDRETLMAPAKLATWKDKDGKDRLVIVEVAGPNRVSEWSADDGLLLREFTSYQTKANNGYAIDPADPSLVYLPGQGGWLTRWKINFDTREWTVDAVWPGVEAGQRKGLDKPAAIRMNGNLYLASEQNLNIYRLAGDRWLRSFALVQNDKKEFFFWRDANGNGEFDDGEYTPTTVPPGALTYHGQRWLADLSYLCMEQKGQSSWRLAPDGFDEHGNPIFTKWEKVWTDPVFVARAEGTADALHGGNELAETYSSDWMQADGSMQDGFYIQARGGVGFSANDGAQHRISRYVPNGKGGFDLKWRVGRTAIDRSAERGEMYGAMRVYKPINGLLTVVDQTRSGLLLYTEDGLYVDTIFPDLRRSQGMQLGVYQQPGEFFAGTIFANPANGKIYYASGKYTPLLFEMEDWSLQKNPVKPLTTVQGKVNISAAQIAAPPEIALSLRGGVGAAKYARFAPAVGGVEMDGSLTGWESAEPVVFQSNEDQTVEVRCFYDPDHLYLRWHARLGSEFQPKALPPLERIFTHDQQADTLGFYIQGDVNAAPVKSNGGRSGDARFVFGLFKKGETLQPVVVGLYPHWPKKPAKAQVYRTPVGEVGFEHVGAVEGAELGSAVDADGKGFVISAKIPRSAIPAMTEPFSEKVRTQVNYDANFGGHNKFWWANRDGSASRETYDEPSEARLYPGSWAPAEFMGIENGIAARNWLILGPFGGPGAEKFVADPRNKKEVEAFYEQAAFPPDDLVVDPAVKFTGEQIAGYWKPNKEISWKPAEIADMDTRVVLGAGSQVWYGATWIYSPQAADVEFILQGHKMTFIRWFLNGERMALSEKDYVDDKALHRRIAKRSVQLRAGWNSVFFRGYNTGYAPFKIGLVVNAPNPVLWSLRFSGKPPSGN